MFATDKLTTYEIERRMDSLPRPLASALASEDINHVVESICQDRHLADQGKIASIKQLVALVIMGFVHAYDIATEINSQLGLENPKLSADIAAALDAKIFSPIRVDLDANYNPKTEENEIDKLVDLFDFWGVMLTPEAAPAEKPKKINKPSPVDSIRSPKTTGPQPLATLTAEKSVAPSSPPIKPAFTAVPAALPSFSPAPAKSAAAPTPPSAPATKPTPAPFMIQTETKAQPITQAPKFTMESLGKIVSVFGGKAPSSIPQPKAAQVEIGIVPEKALTPSGVVSKFESSPRTIHYGGPSTPLPGSPAPTPSGPVSFGTLRGMPSAPRPSLPPNIPASAMPSSVPPPAKPFVPPSSKPATPPPPGAGGFIKTLITPKNELAASPLPIPPPPPSPR